MSNEPSFTDLVKQMREFEMTLNDNIGNMNQSIDLVYRTLKNTDPKKVSIDQISQFAKLVEQRETFYRNQMHDYKRLLDQLQIMIKKINNLD